MYGGGQEYVQAQGIPMKKLIFLFCILSSLSFLSAKERPEVPKELQKKLEYVRDSSNCTMKNVENLEKELLAFYPEDDFVFSITKRRKGILYLNSQKYDRCMKELSDALDIAESSLTKRNQDTADVYTEMANIYDGLGRCHTNRADYDKALEYHEKALAIRKKIVGEEHLLTANSYYNIGEIYYSKGDYDRALEYYGHTLDIWKKVLGEENTYTAALYNNIGNAYDNKGDYDRALEYYGRSLDIKKKVRGEEHPDTAGSYNNIGNIYFKNGDYDRALEYYRRALDIRKKVLGEGHPDTATSYNNIGLVYADKGDYDRALEYYGRALDIRKKILGEEHPSTAISYNSIGAVYYDKGDYDRALEYYGRALDIQKKVLGEEHPSTAISYNEIGAVYYDKGDYDRALEYHGRALDIKKKVRGEEHPDTAISYNNIGLVYADKGDYDKALEYYGRALDIRKKALGEKHPDMAMSYNKIGEVYRYKGDYARALEYHGRALDIRKKVLGEEHPDTAMSYTNIGIVYYKKGDYARALEYYGRALDIRKKVLGEEHPSTAISYNNIGAVYYDKGDYDRALEYYGRALDIQKKVLGEEHPDTAISYNNIGNVYGNKGDHDRALEYHGRALDIRKKVLGEEHPYMATSYNNIGNVYDNKGDHDRALEYHGRALDIRKKVLGEEHPDTATSYHNMGVVYYKKKEYAETASYWRKSWKVIRESTEYAKSLGILKSQLFFGIPDTDFLRDALVLATNTVERARLDMSSMKDNLLKESLPVYYFAVDFESKNKNPGKAFEYSEALRSRGFLDQLGTEAALRLDGVSDAERGQVQKLVARISKARKELERQGKLTKDKRDEKLYKKAGDELASAEKELAALDDSIGKRLPAYAQLRNPKTVDVKAAQKWCGRNRAVLEYVLPEPDSGTGSWCIVVTEKKVEAVSLDGGYDYADAVNQLRKGVRDGLYEDQFEEPRNELYGKLLAPVLARLGKNVEELVIVPDRNLALLPFDMLRKDAASACLGDSYPVSCSPSVSVSVLSSGTNHAERKVLAFGGAWYDSSLNDQEHSRALSGKGRGCDRGALATDYDFNADNDAQQAYMKNYILENGPGDYFLQKGLKWKDLPGTLAEVNTLREKVFTSVGYDERLQKKASESELKRLSTSGQLKGYSVVHLACHGYFDKNMTEMSSVVFSEVSGRLTGISQEDGYLTIPETALLNLDADMVCLSACDTGRGKIRKGDGMVGLPRAFMVAGARHVGVSLWNIDDEATAEFMVRMYRKVEKEGKSYSRAYREVKAEFRTDAKWDHPYYWAAFVLYE